MLYPPSAASKTRPSQGREKYLVDCGWKLIEVRPSVELALGNGYVTANGHRAEATEPQQSMFSWAEFMAEEPVKPKGRGRKPQPATLSMFEWALTQEQEREEEPVGAGR